MQPSPVVIVEHMKTVLPQQRDLARRCHRSYPFNTNSYKLYDVLINNNHIVADFSFEQTVHYTYLNVMCNSYIDHAFVSRFYDKCVSKCKIISDVANNVSDHHSIYTSIVLAIQSDNISSNESEASYDIPIYPKMYWPNNKLCALYHDYV